jgi:NADPH:quinone reductase-like Zn-dependent oxidoreductase
MQKKVQLMAIPESMNAARLHNRGGIDQLFFEQAPLPVLEKGDVLVQVMASGITKAELDWDETYRNADGSDRLPSIPGHEMAGIVARIRSGTTDWSPGDRVFGLTPFNRDGTLAQFVAVSGDFLSPLSSQLDFIKGAAIPLAGLTAWQALFTHGALKAGQKVLIHGGAGGVGTYAVQLAKWAGATVFATASTSNIDFLKKIGADHAIDYTATNFDEVVENVDLVLDTVGGETRNRSWQVLRSGGLLLAITGPLLADEPPSENMRGMFFIVEPNRIDLASITKLIEKGIVTPFVQATFPLQDVRSAFELSNRGHGRGKTIVRIAD